MAGWASSEFSKHTPSLLISMTSTIKPTNHPLRRPALSRLPQVRLGACLHKDDKDWTRRVGNERHLVRALASAGGSWLNQGSQLAGACLQHPPPLASPSTQPAQ